MFKAGDDRIRDAGRIREAVGPVGDPLAGAVEFAFGYLGRRERTVGELRRHLERKGVEASVVDRALVALIEDGYLDDARLARVFAQDKCEFEDWGEVRIRRALLERGVDRELVDAAIAGCDSEGEFGRALALLRRRFPSAPGDRRGRERALGVLLRKGYDTELALEALVAFAGEAGG